MKAGDHINVVKDNQKIHGIILEKYEVEYFDRDGIQKGRLQDFMTTGSIVYTVVHSELACPIEKIKQLEAINREIRTSVGAEMDVRFRAHVLFEDREMMEAGVSFVNEKPTQPSEEVRKLNKYYECLNAFDAGMFLTCLGGMLAAIVVMSLGINDLYTSGIIVLILALLVPSIVKAKYGHYFLS